MAPPAECGLPEPEGPGQSRQDQAVELTETPTLSFSAPPALLRPPNAHPLRIFVCPHPNHNLPSCLRHDGLIGWVHIDYSEAFKLVSEAFQFASLVELNNSPLAKGIYQMAQF